MDLLTQYNVNFYKRSRNGNVYDAARGGGLAEFLDTYTDPESVQEGLDMVNYVLNAGVADWEHSSISAELYTAWLNNIEANIYPSFGNTEKLLQTIPLADFKEILELWLAFLNS